MTGDIKSSEAGASSSFQHRKLYFILKNKGENSINLSAISRTHQVN